MSVEIFFVFLVMQNSVRIGSVVFEDVEGLM